MPATKEKKNPTAVNDDGDPVNPEAFLTFKGWTKVSADEAPNRRKRWLDPESGKSPRMVQIGEETYDDGRASRPIMQRHVGSAPWYYAEAEAVAIQQNRDKVTK